jgi:tRNA(Ile)-lysidine synthase
MKSFHLINKEKSNLVAVSGGVDSLALMYVLNDIFRGNLRVLHINHGTRAENDQEENLVRNHGELLGLEVDVVKFTMNLDQNNFEAVARNLRAEVYKQYLHKNYLVYTAHHLDDSFEWSMIQSFRQSLLQSTLGIPVYNRGLVRPFMCVSKNQIRMYAKALGLSWAEDSSNRDTRFERNFFRAKLTSTIRKRYPQYLRHYVARQNALALKLNLHRSLFLNEPQFAPLIRLDEKREASGAVVLRSQDFSHHKDQIKEWIHFFSKTHRGEINREVDKLIEAHKKIGSDPREPKIKGPLSFSGGVKIHILRDYLLITNELHMDYYRKCDELLLQRLEHTIDVTQITERDHKKPVKAFFPYLCFLSKEDKSKSSKLIHPLLPKSTQWLREHKIPYSFYPLIQKKGKQKLFHNAVILDSSGLGL